MEGWDVGCCCQLMKFMSFNRLERNDCNVCAECSGLAPGWPAGWHDRVLLWVLRRTTCFDCMRCTKNLLKDSRGHKGPVYLTYCIPRYISIQESKIGVYIDNNGKCTCILVHAIVPKKTEFSNHLTKEYNTKKDTFLRTIGRWIDCNLSSINNSYVNNLPQDDIKNFDKCTYPLME